VRNKCWFSCIAGNLYLNLFRVQPDTIDFFDRFLLTKPDPHSFSAKLSPLSQFTTVNIQNTQWWSPPSALANSVWRCQEVCWLFYYDVLFLKHTCPPSNVRRCPVSDPTSRKTSSSLFSRFSPSPSPSPWPDEGVFAHRRQRERCCPRYHQGAPQRKYACNLSSKYLTKSHHNYFSLHRLWQIVRISSSRSEQRLGGKVPESTLRLHPLVNKVET